MSQLTKQRKTELLPGRDAGIRMRIVPVPAGQSGADLAVARVNLCVAGAPIWGPRTGDTQDTLTDVSPCWPLVDLLHGLARI